MSVHSAVSGRPLQVVVDQRGTGKDVEYFSDDPRVFYRGHRVSGLEWTLGVDEAVPGR